MCSNFVGLWGKSQDPGPTTGGDPGKPPFGLGSDFKEQHIRRKGDPEVIRLLHDHSLAAHPQVSQTIPSPDTGSRRSHIAHVFKNLEKEKKNLSGVRYDHPSSQIILQIIIQIQNLALG